MRDDQALELQRATLRAMTSTRRLRLAFEMSDLARRLSRAGIRKRHPDWSDGQVTRELVRAAFAPHPSPW